MYLTVHAASAGIISQSTTHVWLAFLIGVISHYILDIIPHGDENLGENLWQGKKIKYLYTIAAADNIFAIAVLIYLFKLQTLNPVTLTAVALGVTLPDILWGLDFVIPNIVSSKYRLLHHNIHHLLHYRFGLKVNPPVGLIIQAAAFAVFIALAIS